MGTDYGMMERNDKKVIDPGSSTDIAESVIPFYTDDTKKAKYLSYRLNCFSVAESCKLADVHLKTIRRWREADPQFKKLDVDDIGELRRKLSTQFLDIEFSRNFRLIMQKDFQVIWKSLSGGVMTKEDTDYLLKLRSHYTPQQLAMIKQLLDGGTVSQPFDFTKLTLTLKRERETVEIKTE